MIAFAITVISGQCLATIIGNAILCVPKPGVSWFVADSKHKCRSTSVTFGVVLAAIGVFSDLLVILIPIPVIWRLQLSTKKKIGVSVIFFTAIL